LVTLTIEPFELFNTLSRTQNFTIMRSTINANSEKYHIKGRSTSDTVRPTSHNLQCRTMQFTPIVTRQQQNCIYWLGLTNFTTLSWVGYVLYVDNNVHFLILQ